MRRLLAIALLFMLELSTLAVAVPLGPVGPEPFFTAAPSAPGTGPWSPNPDALAAPREVEPGVALAGSAATQAGASEPKGQTLTTSRRQPYETPWGPETLGVPIEIGGIPAGQLEQEWWYARELGPTPNSVNISSTTSLILFVEDGAVRVQVPTDADIAAGAKPIAFANNTTRPFRFTGKLFETIVGNGSINSSNDIDIGVPDQFLDLFFDGLPLAVGYNVTTGNNTTIYPAPFRFSNGTFTFQVSRWPDYGCGAHVLRVQYDSGSYGNNASFFASTSRDFRIWVSCKTTLSVFIDENPTTVGNSVTLFGLLQDSKVQPVANRPVRLLMEASTLDFRLQGPTGPGVYLDEVAITGTNFFDDFETNNTGWNQTGTGVGSWQIGQVTLPDGPCGCPPNFFPPSTPGSARVAGTGLERYYGRGVDTWLKSPPLDLSSPSDPYPQLSFYYWYQMSFDDSFSVAVSVDGGNTYAKVVKVSANATSGYVKSAPDGNGNPTWAIYALNLTEFIGVSNLVVGFHFDSAKYTTKTSNTGAYSFNFIMPFDTTADTHTIKAEFGAGIKMDYSDGVTVQPDPGVDLTYEYTESLEQIRLIVRRIAHFSFTLSDEAKIGYRSLTLNVCGRLLDNMNEPLKSDPLNPQEKILVRIEWDLDYNDPFDTPKLIKDFLEAGSDGNFCFLYVVDVQQHLGLHNVSFSFEGSPKAKYYTGVTTIDPYRLMAHTYSVWPPDPLRQVFRFANATVNGSLRVVPAESRFSRQIGDPVDGELVHITWTDGGATTEIPEGQVGVLTDSTGAFFARKFVPFDAELGKKVVTLTYTGSDIYVGLQSPTNWSVVSTTTILFEETSVYKGNYVFFNGTMLDDRGVGVGNQTLTIFFDNQTVAILPTTNDGTYTYPYLISEESTVGAKQVLIRFVGNPIYLKNETISYVPVKAHTQILRTDHTQIVDRAKRLNVTGEIFEVYEGGRRGSAIGQEPITIRIRETRLTVETSNTEGRFSFRSTVPPDLAVGEAALVYEYPGSDYYDPAANETFVVIRGESRVVFDIPTMTKNGQPFDPRNQTVKQEEELEGFVRVTDELGQILQSGDVTFCYAIEQSLANREERCLQSGPVDDLGRFKFNISWNDFVIGNRTLIAHYNGSYCPTFISPRTLCVRPATGNLTISYVYKTPPEPEADPLIYYVVIASVAAILGATFYIFYYQAKRRQLAKMQRIIRRAADRLVAGNAYAQTIFQAYRSLARVLQTQGYLRREHETFREFEQALRTALPIDARSMDEFLSILEEARYSDHEIGPEQRDRAIEALKSVNQSISQIILTGAAAARAPPPPPPAAPPPMEAPAAPATGPEGAQGGATEAGKAPPNAP